MLFTSKELNMRQRRWLELIKDCDCTIFHPCKANVVADMLGKKLVGGVAYLGIMQSQLMIGHVPRIELTD